MAKLLAMLVLASQSTQPAWPLLSECPKCFLISTPNRSNPLPKCLLGEAGGGDGRGDDVLLQLRTSGLHLRTQGNSSFGFFKFLTARIKQKLVSQHTIDYLIIQVIEIMKAKNKKNPKKQKRKERKKVRNQERNNAETQTLGQVQHIQKGLCCLLYSGLSTHFHLHTMDSVIT